MAYPKPIEVALPGGLTAIGVPIPDLDLIVAAQAPAGAPILYGWELDGLGAIVAPFLVGPGAVCRCSRRVGGQAAVYLASAVACTVAVLLLDDSP